ncbi:NUDIX domain-containing protein [Patescibacteria group bacterium]|nr:NUDIX domain-containing protein [Patescibacteria group bacterium]
MEKDKNLEKDFYRKNVSLVTFDKKGRFLLVNLVHWPLDYFKFPQGGIGTGETLEQAAHREFEEELGTSKIEILAVSDIRRTYKWENPIEIENKKYVGQKQRFMIVRFFGNDEDISLKKDEVRGCKWVDGGELEGFINRKELDFSSYWATIRRILKENQDLLQANGVVVCP